MFGNKQDKRKRLEQVRQLIETDEQHVNDLARQLGVSRYAIYDDLHALEKRGVPICRTRRGWFVSLRALLRREDKRDA